MLPHTKHDRTVPVLSSHPAPQRTRLERIRLLLGFAILLAAITVGIVYWIGHHRAVKPNAPVAHVGLNIRETANGFELSRSEGGRTLFTVHAKVATLGQNNRALLRQVQVQAFEPDGVHADQIFGQEFEYDANTGEVSDHGLVHIDLEGVPQKPAPGTSTAMAEEVGNPVHLEANDLVFNTKSGSGDIRQGLVFHYLNAQGSASTAHLSTRPDVVTLSGNVILHWLRPQGAPVTVTAAWATLQRDSGLITLGSPAQIQTRDNLGASQSLTADQLVLHLRPDYSIASAQALGAVHAQSQSAQQQLRASANAATALFVEPPKRQAGSSSASKQFTAAKPTAKLTSAPLANATNVLFRQLQLNGAVHLREMHAQVQDDLRAGMLTLFFGADNTLEHGETRGGTRLLVVNTQSPPGRSRRAPLATVKQLDHRSSATGALSPLGGPGRRVLTAPGLDFTFQPLAQAPAGVRRSPGSPAILPVEIHSVVSVGRAQLTSLQRVSAPVGGATFSKHSISGRSSAIETNRIEADLIRASFNNRGQIRQANGDGHVALSQQLDAPAQPPLLRTSTCARLSARFISGRLSQVTEQGNVDFRQQQQELRSDNLVYNALSGIVLLIAQKTSAYTDGLVRGTSPAADFAAPLARWVVNSSALTASGGVQVSMLPGSSGFALMPAMRTAGRSSTRAAAPKARVAGSNPLNGSKLPVNITASQAEMNQQQGWATFRGAVRLWQGSNLMLASQLHLDRNSGRMSANGVRSSFPASAQALAPAPTSRGAKSGGPLRSQPMTIAARQFTYSQKSNQAIYSGNVVVLSDGMTMKADRLVASIAPTGSSATSRASAASGSSGIQRIDALGHVRVTAPGRHARADRAVYLVQSRQVTLSGGPPSISDAELGFLTGRSLTFSPLGGTIRVESQPGARTYGLYRVHR